MFNNYLLKHEFRLRILYRLNIPNITLNYVNIPIYHKLGTNWRSGALARCAIGSYIYLHIRWPSYLPRYSVPKWLNCESKMP